VDRYHWLLVFHLAGAFLVLGGATIAGIFNIAALRRERPSEIAALFSLTRVAVISVMAGMPLVLIFGLWLVSDANYGWGDTWIVAALVLWVAANALGGAGGKRDKRTRRLAEQLATQGDQPSVELRARLRDPVSLTLSWGSGLAVVAILALMIWKPGA
jgi:uncharacterized membrane protein